MAIADPRVADLCAFLGAHHRVAVLTGAGCSTASGIPAYRDDAGRWTHHRPPQYAEFMKSPGARRRYWAQSFAGWHRMASARPNPAHLALVRLEDAGRATCVITQNVDNLHRAAGHRKVIDLHGVVHRIRCLACDTVEARADFQLRLQHSNRGWKAPVAAFAPDGDARLTVDDVDAFIVPDCRCCGGIVKPDVVFFGESVPPDRVREASELLEQSDALLVVGSSLMVYSGYRFVRLANARGLPVAIVNRGATRADGIAAYRLSGDCCTLLAAAVSSLGAC
jgi:NAD-dependent SIR2 family protein deacetylase